MESLFKGLKKGKSNKHQKLPDRWNVEQSPVKDGVTFTAKYLGSTLVEELEDEAESYGHSISTEAVKTIFTMAKASGKKLPNMNITVSQRGIKVTDIENSSTFTDLDIYRINFCTADKHHDKVFAYIARSTENETMECHAFLCAKRKVARAITLTVAQAFHLAKEEIEKKEQKDFENRHKRAFENSSPPQSPIRVGQSPAEIGQSPTRVGQSSPCVIPSSPIINLDPVSLSSSPVCHMDTYLSASPAQTTKQPQSNVMGFEDNFVPPSSQQGFEDNFTDILASLPASQMSTRTTPMVPAPVADQFAPKCAQSLFWQGGSEPRMTKGSGNPTPTVDDLLCL